MGRRHSLIAASFAAALLIGCQGGGIEAPPTVVPAVPAPPTVVATALASAGAASCVSLVIDYAPGARGKPGDPVDLAKTAITGLQVGDVVARGDPAEVGAIRIVRAGEIVGNVRYMSDGNGGWLLEGGSLCGGLSFKP